MGKGKQKKKIHDIEKHVEEKDLTTQSCVGVTVLQTLYCMLHRHSTWGRIREIEGESEWKRKREGEGGGEGGGGERRRQTRMIYQGI